MNDRWEELSKAILRQSREKGPVPETIPEARLEFQTDVARVALGHFGFGGGPDWLGGSAIDLRDISRLASREIVVASQQCQGFVHNLRDNHVAFDAVRYRVVAGACFAQVGSR